MRKDTVNNLKYRIYCPLSSNGNGRLLERPRPDLPRPVDIDAIELMNRLAYGLYLETRRGLELQSQGGARTRVKALEPVDLQARPDGDGFRATATWQVAGAVGAEATEEPDVLGAIDSHVLGILK